MDTESCTVFSTLCHQSIHVISTTDTFTDISIIRMCGIVTFICVTF